MIDGDFMNAGRRESAGRLSQARSRPRRSGRALRTAPMFAVTSGKGGVGKTNVVANVAAALAFRGQRVLAMDADVGLANLDLLFGVKPAHTMADFFSGMASFDEIITTTNQGVLLLPGANGVRELTTLSGAQKLALAGVLENIKRRVDLVIVDTCSGIFDAATYFAAAAQEIVVVVTPEPASMTDAYAFIKILALTYAVKRFHILANNAVDENQARRLFDGLSHAAVRFLNVSLDYLGWIPHDPKLLAAVSQSRLVVEESKEAPSTLAFGAVAGRLEELAAAGGRANGNLQFLFQHVL